MKRRFVDPSIYWRTTSSPTRRRSGSRVTHHTHEDTAGQIASFPGLQKADLPDVQGWAVEAINLSMHNGTHLDAHHFHPTINRAERAITIDEVRLEWCFQPGVKLDFRNTPDGHCDHDH